MQTVLHSYSFRKYSLDHVYAVARAGAWPAVELSGWHLTDENTHRGVTAAVETGRRHGVAVYCVGYYGDFITTDHAEWKRAIDKVCDVVDACADNGVTLVNGFGGWLVRSRDELDNWCGNGSSIATEPMYRRVADAYREVAAYAADRGVRVAVEIHPNTVHDTVASTSRLLKLVDHENLLITVDPSNAASLSPDDKDCDVVDLIAEQVAYFHLKNCTIHNGVASFDVETAAGLIDNYRWLERLVRLPRFAAVCIEYCGHGDPHPRIAAARRYLEETLRIIELTLP
jgi:sugar phosphate isomerase/epimerase